jgi:hypothetical protein
MSDMPLAEVKRKVDELRVKIEAKLSPPSRDPVTQLWSGGRGGINGDCKKGRSYTKSMLLILPLASVNDTFFDLGVGQTFRLDVDGAPEGLEYEKFFWLRQAVYLKTDIDGVGSTFTKVYPVLSAKMIFLPYPDTNLKEEVNPVTGKKTMKPGFYVDCFGNPLDE